MEEEVVIFVPLVDEGTRALRPVRARRAGEDRYVILDPVPELEVWEFQPGDEVRCNLQSDERGDFLAAFELAAKS